MITGSIVALITPMEPETLAVDWAAFKRLLDWHIEQGTDAIVAVGTTGESATLTMAENIEVIRACVEHVAGRVPVIAGTGANSTAEALELTRGAKQADADACLLVTPYYNKPTQEGLYRHYRTVAEAVDMPQILYNVPGRTGCDMLPETVLRLAGVTNIVGVKEATGNIERARQLIENSPPEFAVYSGDDPTAVELMLLGGHGNISVTANVVPATMHAICAAAMAGDAEKARALDETLAPLHRALFVESNPIPVKWALAEMGLAQHNAIRLPLTPLAAAFHAQVRAAMAAVGVGKNTT